MAKVVVRHSRPVPRGPLLSRPSSRRYSSSPSSSLAARPAASGRAWRRQAGERGGDGEQAGGPAWGRRAGVEAAGGGRAGWRGGGDRQAGVQLISALYIEYYSLSAADGLATSMPQKKVSLLREDDQFGERYFPELELCYCNELISLKIPFCLEQLSFLKVSDCDMLQVIDCTAPNISTFVFFGEPLRQVPGHKHDRLKKVQINGFCSAKSMVELACHILETATALESLTLDTIFDAVTRCSAQKNGECMRLHKKKILEAHKALLAIKRYILGRVPSTDKLKGLVSGPASASNRSGKDDVKLSNLTSATGRSRKDNTVDVTPCRPFRRSNRAGRRNSSEPAFPIELAEKLHDVGFAMEYFRLTSVSQLGDSIGKVATKLFRHKQWRRTKNN
ncbi:hypothetical protein PR202_gb14138 [Eleusine coracana subsp. coracana]|uniref:At1g61320/AtMIF1 LRR domain-containing protein n=1 Tax=Eleusine coracana subsp. coracana TaxID=191504 RepID=A0AAV5EUQ1_ELECO|nr:hypothetical protein PR202_gb14138 [Eleusine coracana subsp. coracana]